MDLSKVKILYTSNSRYAAGVYASEAYKRITLAELDPGDYINTGETVIKKKEIFIIVHMNIAKLLTEEELYAVLCHEHGHILHGHLDSPSGELLNNLAYEYAADDYAITCVPVDLYIVALSKVIKFQLKLMCKISGLSTKKVKEMCKGDFDNVAKRIERLTVR